MSSISRTVLISVTGGGPWGDRAPEPIWVAQLWVGGSANWVFTSLLPDATGGTIRPRGPEDAAAALLVGIAVHLVQDAEVCALWQTRADAKGQQRGLNRAADEALVTAAQKVIMTGCKLSIIHDEGASDSISFAQALADMQGLDIEVLVPRGELFSSP